MQTTEVTVSAYIKSLPSERARTIREVRALVKANLPSGYKEVIRWGMITWEVPLRRYPGTYNGQPLSYVGLAAQKNSYSLYLMGCYSSAKSRQDFERRYRASGKRMDLGKSCVRFKKLDDLPIELIAETVREFSVDEFIELYEVGRGRSRKKVTPYRETYPDGTLKAIGQYRGKLLHGKWKWFRKSGVIMRSGEFKDGKQVGRWVTYDKEGHPYKETQF